MAAYRGLLEPGQTSAMEFFFVKVMNDFKLLTIFGKKAPSQMFDWVESRLLKILSSLPSLQIKPKRYSAGKYA